MPTLTQLREFETDAAHDADMEELRLEQLRADCGDEPYDEEYNDE